MGLYVFIHDNSERLNNSMFGKIDMHHSRTLGLFAVKLKVLKNYLLLSGISRFYKRIASLPTMI